MDGDASNEVIRRRLPPWMLGVAAADKGGVEISNKSNDNRDIEDDGNGSREDEVKVNKRGGRRPKSKAPRQRKRDDFSEDLELEEVEEEEKGKSSSLVVKRGDRKRTKRKLNLDVEDAPKQKKRNGRAKRNAQSSEDAIVGTCLENNEDEDLTVEDLMTFATECVEENIGAKEGESTKEEISSRNQIGDIDQLGNSIDDQENKRFSERQEMNSSNATTGNVKVTSEVSVCKPKMSGDPTQDMLDLFLGPLLKKTQEKEKKVDLSTDEMNFNIEMKRQNTSAAPGKEQATITATKKRSSLRDRVAMFLD